MRLNDVVNQYATISEIAVRQPSCAHQALPRIQDALALAEPRQNANYERQLVGTQIANDRAEQSDADLREAESRRQAIDDSREQGAELASILEESRNQNLDAYEREELQARFQNLLEDFANRRNSSESSDADAADDSRSASPTSTASISTHHRTARAGSRPRALCQPGRANLDLTQAGTEELRRSRHPGQQRQNPERAQRPGYNRWKPCETSAMSSPTSPRPWTAPPT